jgi:hypothetical protein
MEVRRSHTKADHLPPSSEGSKKSGVVPPLLYVPSCCAEG